MHLPIFLAQQRAKAIQQANIAHEMAIPAIAPPLKPQFLEPPMNNKK